MPAYPHRTLPRRLATAVVFVLLLAGCGSGSDDSAGRTGASPTSPTAGATGAAPPGSAGSGAAAPRTEFSRDPVVVERAEAGRLVAVRSESVDGVDRLTFEFSGSAPGYRVEQVPRVTAGPEGDVVELAGETFLNVAFTSTTPGIGGPISDDVPTNETLDLPVLRQLVLVHNVGGDLWFGVGLHASAPIFRVVPRSHPNRLVVEVRAG
jgi:hypothetical protein